MAQKEYLKMADYFYGEIDQDDVVILDCGLDTISQAPEEAAAHAINSHDELVAEVERLRCALTSSRLALSNAAMNMKWFDISKAQEILREVNSIDKLISAIGTSDAKI